MNMRVVGLRAVVMAAGVCLATPSFAQTPDEEAAAEAVETPTAISIDTSAVTDPVTIAKLTPVVIEILDPLGSKLSNSLDTYRIRLAEPIVVEGTELVPAGAEGMGEVVHAKKAGGMGAAGELVLAARYLTVDGRQLRLRSMELLEDAEGKDRMGTVHTLNIASAAAPIPIGLLGYFIGGGNIEIPAGARASAKLAAPFAFTPVSSTAAEAGGEEPASRPQGDQAETTTLTGPEGGTDETEEGLQ